MSSDQRSFFDRCAWETDSAYEIVMCQIRFSFHSLQTFYFLISFFFSSLPFFPRECSLNSHLIGRISRNDVSDLQNPPFFLRLLSFFCCRPFLLSAQQETNRPEDEPISPRNRLSSLGSLFLPITSLFDGFYLTIDFVRTLYRDGPPSPALMAASQHCQRARPIILVETLFLLT